MKIELRKLVVVLVFGFIACIVAACGNNETANNVGSANNANSTVKTPVPSATVDELASGKKVYEVNCRICHKDNGTGGKVTIEGRTIEPDDLTSEKIKAFSDEKIIGYILKGIPDEGMPSFKDKLSEGEMRDVVRFIRKEFHKQ